MSEEIRQLMETLPTVEDFIDQVDDEFELLFYPKPNKELIGELKEMRNMIASIVDTIKAETTPSVGRDSTKRDKRIKALLRTLTVVSKAWAEAMSHAYKSYADMYKAYITFLVSVSSGDSDLAKYYIPPYSADVIATIERYKMAKSEFYVPKSSVDEVVSLIRAFFPQLPEGIAKKIAEEIGKALGFVKPEAQQGQQMAGGGVPQ